MSGDRPGRPTGERRTGTGDGRPIPERPIPEHRIHRQGGIGHVRRIPRGHAAAGARDVGVGRQGHVGDGWVRHVVDRVHDRRCVGGDRRRGRRLDRHRRGVRRGRERANHRLAASPGTRRVGPRCRAGHQVHAGASEGQRRQGPARNRCSLRSSGWGWSGSTCTRSTVRSAFVAMPRWPRPWRRCTQEGLVDAVGVSNYSVREMGAIHAELASRGLALASNQIEFSLLRNRPLTTGLIRPASRLGVVPLAYSPIGQGRLTGKYSASNPPPGKRGFSDHPMDRVDTVVAALRRIGAAHGDRTPSQVALRWLIATRARCRSRAPRTAHRRSRTPARSDGR